MALTAGFPETTSYGHQDKAGQQTFHRSISSPVNWVGAVSRMWVRVAAPWVSWGPLAISLACPPPPYYGPGYVPMRQCPHPTAQLPPTSSLFPPRHLRGPLSLDPPVELVCVCGHGPARARRALCAPVPTRRCPEERAPHGNGGQGPQGSQGRAFQGNPSGRGSPGLASRNPPCSSSLCSPVGCGPVPAAPALSLPLSQEGLDGELHERAPRDWRLPPPGRARRRTVWGGQGARANGRRWQVDPRRRAHGPADGACAGPQLAQGVRGRGAPAGLGPCVPVSTACSGTVPSS